MVERPRLDAVLLDAGGTLVRLDFDWMAQTICDAGHRVTPDALRRAEVHGRKCYDASSGRALLPGDAHPALGSKGDTEAYFMGMLRAAGVPDRCMASVESAFRAKQAEPVGLWGITMEGARDALDALARLGLALGVVSNSDGRAEAHLTHGGVREGLAFVIDSQIVGVEKPDPAIFRMALERLGTAAGRTLFIGDIRAVDETGARAAGLPFVLLDPYGDYGDGSSPAISAIGALPEWIVAHYDVPAKTAGPGSRPAGSSRPRGE